MDKDFFKDYALSEENVYQLYNYCKQTSSTKIPQPTQLYRYELCGQNSPMVVFDAERVFEHLDKIPFMLGQLKAVHDKQDFMTPQQGFFNYRGEQWTTNQAAVFALYHLALAVDFLSPFIKTKNNTLFTDTRNIPITYPLNDPKHMESFKNIAEFIKNAEAT